MYAYSQYAPLSLSVYFVRLRLTIVFRFIGSAIIDGSLFRLSLSLSPTFIHIVPHSVRCACIAFISLPLLRCI